MTAFNDKPNASSKDAQPKTATSVASMRPPGAALLRAVPKPLTALAHLKPLNKNDFPNPPGSSWKLPQTMPNVAYMLKAYGIEVHYNVIKKTAKITLPKGQVSSDNGQHPSSPGGHRRTALP